MGTVLTATQDVVYTVDKVSLRDRKGNPATIQPDTGEWESSDPSILTVTEDPNDEFKAVASAVGPAGAAMVTWKADGDPSPGVKDIIITDDVIVNPGTVATGSFVVGSPTEQPA